jgi:dephospho-CoA kinase
VRVGLTGGIATGKSHVLRGLAAAGLHVLDLDRVAHALLLPGGAAYEDVRAAFGPRVLAADGTIDRKALGEVVFAEPAERERLNALVHPRIREAESAWVSGLAGDPRAVLVTDAALLVETGMHLRFARLVVTWCPAQQQLARLLERDGLSRAAAESRLAAQMSVDEKREFAHEVVDTSGTLAETDAQVVTLAARLREEAAHPPELTPLRPAEAVTLLQHPAASDLLRAARERAALDVAALARKRGCLDSWHRCGAAFPSSEGAFVGGIVLFALETVGWDPDWIASATGSVARVFLAPGPSRVQACLDALVLAERLATGLTPSEERWRPLAQRWGSSGS